MTELGMSGREVDDVLAGRQPDGRADLAVLAGVTAVLRASREVEPPPPMSGGLQTQLDSGVTSPREVPPRSQRGPGVRGRKAACLVRAGLAGHRRPLISIAAAGAVLAGLVGVTATALHDPVHSAVIEVGSALGIDGPQGDQEGRADVAPPAPSTTTGPSTTVAPRPPESGSAAPRHHGPAPDFGWDLVPWLAPELWGRDALDGRRADATGEGHASRNPEWDGAPRGGWRDDDGDGRTDRATAEEDGQITFGR